MDHRTSQVNVDVPPGKYKVKFTLKDAASGRTDREELNVKLDNLEERSPSMSHGRIRPGFQSEG